MINGKQIKDSSIRTQKILIDSHLDMNTYRIHNLGLPINDNDAASKSYVDSISQSLSIKEAVKVATSDVSELQNTNSSLYVYNANIGGGEGNDYWSNIISPKSIDGIPILNGNRILIKNATDAKGNGIWVYNVTQNKFLRAPDANNQNAITSAEVKIGMFCFVEQGTLNANVGFVLSASGGSPISSPIYTLGIDTLTFTQFSSVGTILSGDALSKSGNTLNVRYDDVTIGLNSNKLYTKPLSIKSTHLSSNSVTEGKIFTNAVTNTKIANLAITYDKLNSNVIYGSGAIALYTTGVPGYGLSVLVDGLTIEIVSNALQIKDRGVTPLKIDIDSLIAGDSGLIAVGSPVSSIAVYPHSQASIEVTSSGIKSAVLYKTQKVASAIATGDNVTTGVTIVHTPAGGSHVMVFVDKMLEDVGAAIGGSPFYFSNDAGITAKPLNGVEAGDVLYFNESKAGYSLTAANYITLVYSKIN